MNKCLEDQECTDKCRYVEHGNTVCAVLTKRCVSDDELCSYMYHTCSSCESVRDENGRLSLHVAASCGRVNVVKWLLQYKHANINAKDLESGYTALHRSIFYGKINVAVCLTKLGANLTLTDSNNLTMLEHAMKDQKELPNINEGEIYVWGSNINYTLGPQQARSVPELMDIFHKEHPQTNVKQICLSKFHCVIVTVDGKVYTCGHGQGGRLGLSTEHSVLNPKLVNFQCGGHTKPVTCIRASIARDHSIFLTDSGQIWICGLNTYHVLGIHPPPPYLLTPKPLNILQHPIKDVCAARYHTVAWGPESLYTWGLHGGQLGHDKNTQKYVISPRLVPNFFGSGATITAVAASNSATAVATSKGDVYVLHEYQRRRIASRVLNIIAISIIGGQLDTSIDNSLTSEISYELKVIALTDTGNLLLWQQSDPQLSRCIFSINRLIKVKQVALNTNGIIFVTTDGEAFEGNIRLRKKKTSCSNDNEKSSFHKFLEKDDCIMVKITKFPHIHRAISIQSDLKGGNFAVIQSNPRYCLTQIPEISVTDIKDNFKKLLNETDVSDQLHDVVFNVSNTIFPAHRYVIALNSNKLEKLMASTKDDIVFIKNVEPEIFEQLLMYMYYKDCDLIKRGQCPQVFLKFCTPLKNDENKEKTVEQLDSNISAYEYYKNKLKCNNTKENCTQFKDPVRLLQECAKKFCIFSLQKLLDNVFYDNGFIKYKNDKTIDTQKMIFEAELFSEYYDVTIKTKSNKEIKAHKCLLAARVEYFNNMFSTRWNESCSGSIITLPFNYTVINFLIQFLYTDTIPSLENEELDNIYSLLILADEFFIKRLKEMCEYILSTYLTLKNVAQILAFSYIYNAKQLKNCCMEFICLNLASILESQILNNIEDDLLNELTDFYCKWNPIMSQRIITPYFTAPSDEVVISFSSYPIPIEHENDNKNVSISKSTKRKHRSHRSNLEKTVGVVDETKDNSSSDETNASSKIVGNNNKQIKNCSQGIPIRLKAINSAQEMIHTENISYYYTKLSSNIKEQVDLLGSSFEDFPELNSPPGHFNSKSPHKHEKIEKTRVVKLSQKQRKRLSSETLVKEPENSAPEIPKNPWKLCPSNTSSPVGSPESKIDAIINEEKKQKENFTKMKSKLLVHTQMEDKAIEELYKFYNIENVFDEILSVDRVQIGIVASPVWVQKSKQSTIFS